MKGHAEFYRMDKSKWQFSKMTSFKIVMSNLFFLYIARKKYEEKNHAKAHSVHPKSNSANYSF